VDIVSKRKHRERAPKHPKFALITVSTSRYMRAKKGEKFADESGDLAVRLLKEAGFYLLRRELVPDDAGEIKRAILQSVYDAGADLVILIGGTGISATDRTVEAISELFDKEIHGFRHIFFLLSYEEVGTDVITTRATAGIVGKSLVVALPGSPDAVALALKKILLQQWRHILHHAREGTP
jgi:molybdenum cofactor biosynthesis protein B